MVTRSGPTALLLIRLFLALVFSMSTAPSQESRFRRGDADGNGVVNIGDAVLIGHSIRWGRDVLPCLDAADTNDDGLLPDLPDLLVLLDELAGGSARIREPFPECGPDPLEDTLPDCVYDLDRCESPSFPEECNANIGISLEVDPPTGPPGSYVRLKIRLDTNREALEDLEIAGWNYSLCLDEGLTAIGGPGEPVYVRWDESWGYRDYKFIAFSGASHPSFDDLEEYLADVAASSWCDWLFDNFCGRFEGFLDIDPTNLEETLTPGVFRDTASGELLTGLLPQTLGRLLWSPELLFLRECSDPDNDHWACSLADPPTGIPPAMSAFRPVDAPSGGLAFERSLIMAHQAYITWKGSLTISPRNGILDADIPIRLDGPPGNYTVRVCGMNLDDSDLMDFTVHAVASSRKALVHLNPCLPDGASQIDIQITEANKSSFRRGDCNDDGEVDLSDAVFLLMFNFLGGEAPPCDAACDANADGDIVATADPIYTLTHRFLGGPPPPAPYPECGAETLPSGTALDCGTPPANCP